MPCRRVDPMVKNLPHVGTLKPRTEQEAVDDVAKLFRIEPAVRDKLPAGYTNALVIREECPISA
jgi:hypothetical protein